VELPHLNVKHAKGRTYAYYRRAGRVIRIQGEPGSRGFLFLDSPSDVSIFSFLAS
jgi:hypothetical protein